MLHYAHLHYILMKVVFGPFLIHPRINSVSPSFDVSVILSATTADAMFLDPFPRCTLPPFDRYACCS